MPRHDGAPDGHGSALSPCSGRGGRTHGDPTRRAGPRRGRAGSGQWKRTGCLRPRKDGEDNAERGRLWPGLLSMLASSRSRPRTTLRPYGRAAGRKTRRTPTRQSFGTPRRIPALAGKPLGVTPWAGETCPDPERLSTGGISGLCP
ncbi:hypothetical protein VR41_09165 [Streptomyces sp. NRRL B-1568]|nr:hypothetical protein VR41_09165 [Streptomyces sp. NRRL B-1568]